MVKGAGHVDVEAWEAWRVEASNYTLTHAMWDYYVDLEECCSSAEVLDWIAQVAHKGWASPSVLAGLVHALDDVFDVQARFCSGGRDMRLSQAEVRTLVDNFVRVHPRTCA